MKKLILTGILCILLTVWGCGQAGEPSPGTESSGEEFTVSETAKETDQAESSEAETEGRTGESESGQAAEQPALQTEEIRETEENTVSAAAPVPQTERETAPAEPETAAPATTEIQETAASQENRLEVTFSIECHKAVEAGNEIALAVAPEGTILPPVSLKLEKGATVFDALMKAAEENGLVIGYQNSGMGAYVYSIQSLAEKACGSKSGWLYRVNGSIQGTGCSNYELKNGDQVIWQYTCDLGEDL